MDRIETPKRMKVAELGKRRQSSVTSKALVYDTLRIIFKYLTDKELRTEEAANNEKGLRSLLYFSGEDYWRPDFYAAVCRTRMRTHVLCNGELMMEPKLAMFFISARVHITFPRKDCYCQLLPRTCNSIYIAGAGVIEDDREYESHSPKRVSLFVPEIPEVRIRTVVWREHQSFRSIFSALMREFDMNLARNYGTPNCLLLFHKEKCNCHTEIVRRLRQWYPREALSIWGGSVHQLNVCQPDEGRCASSVVNVAVALSGPGIRTWSIVVDSDCKTKEQVKRKLEFFKQHIYFRRHSVGLMFASSARGERFYKEPNVESRIFKSFFPTVPLVGCFDCGVFGSEFATDTVSLDFDKKYQKPFHKLSTIFLIITYGQ